MYHSMKEIITRRGLKTKVFTDGINNSYDFHTKHIHFEDGEKLEEIDKSLIGDGNVISPKKTGYVLELDKGLSNKSPFLYGYKGVQFGLLPRGLRWEDKTVVFQDTDSVGGVVEGDAVVYKNAYGEDIDLVVRADNTGIKKIVRINKPIELREGQEFLEIGFEIIGDIDIWYEGVNKKEYNKIRQELSLLDKERLGLEGESRHAEARAIYVKQEEKELELLDSVMVEWDKKTDTRFKGRFQLRYGGQKIYGRDPLVWDNARRNNEKITVELRVRNGKYYFVKLIPASFLKTAKFPIHTDASTDYTAGSGDGYVENYNQSTWSGARDAATGTNNNEVSGTLNSYANKDSSSNWDVVRLFFPIDTSAIDDGVTITSATFKLYATFIIDEDSDSAEIVQASQASTSALENTDFDALTFTSGSSIDLSAITTSAYNNFTLNETGRGWISKTGYTKLALIHGLDLSDTEPAGQNYFECGSSEATNDPTLTVVTLAPSAPNMALLGVG